MACNNPADAEAPTTVANTAPNPLPPTTVDEIFFGQCTYLKYRSNPEKKRDVIKSGAAGGVEKEKAEHHAEMKMLNAIYENYELKGGPLEQHKKELKNELAQQNKHLQDIKKDMKKELDEINPMYKEEKARKEQKAVALRKKIKLTEEGREKLTLKEELKEITQTENEWEKKRQECENKWMEKNQEAETALTHLKNVGERKGNDLRKYIHSNHSSPLSQLKQFLPQEFWVSRSPCDICAQELIRAYKDRDKPTIYIASVYKRKEENLTKLHHEEFQFKLWDLYKEYSDWMERFKKFARYEKYQEIKDQTSEVLHKFD